MRTVLAAVAALALVGSPACDDGPASFRVHPDTLRFAALGDTATLQLIGSDGLLNPLPPTPRYFSRDTTVATVDGDGRVRAVGNGVTAIHARRDGTQDSAVVVVDQRVTDILFVPEPMLDGRPGDTIPLNPRGFDAGGSLVPDAGFVVTSTDSAVARPVDGLAVILADFGTAEVRVTADDAARRLVARVDLTWTEVPGSVGSRITALWVRNGDEVHAGLADGGIAVFSGGDVTVTPLACAAGPAAIRSLSPSLAYGVNEDGCVFRFDGTGWALDPDGPTGRLTDVDGRTADDVWISSFGALYRFDGTAWSSQSLPVELGQRSLRTVATLPGSVYTGGGDGLLLQRSGGWTVLPSETTDPVTHIWGDIDSLYVAADSTRLRTDGAWTTLDGVTPGADTEVARALDGWLLLRPGGLHVLRGTRTSRLPRAPGGQALGYHPDFGVVVAADGTLYRGR